MLSLTSSTMSDVKLYISGRRSRSQFELFLNIRPHSDIAHKADSFISENIYKGKTATYSGNVS